MRNLFLFVQTQKHNLHKAHTEQKVSWFVWAITEGGNVLCRIYWTCPTLIVISSSPSFPWSKNLFLDWKRPKIKMQANVLKDTIFVCFFQRWQMKKMESHFFLWNYPQSNSHLMFRGEQISPVKPFSNMSLVWSMTLIAVFLPLLWLIYFTLLTPGNGHKLIFMFNWCQLWLQHSQRK